MYDTLHLKSGVGRGQENDETDVAAMDNSLRKVGAYSPPPEYADGPQRYITEPAVDALELFQEQNGLKIDGLALPGGPTERAINNHLLGKPQGAGLSRNFGMRIQETVGNGFRNEPADVATVKRALGGLGYLPEDPFDNPSGFIEETTSNAVRRFQRDRGLRDDGWLRPGGETEAALQMAVADLARANSAEWHNFSRRADAALDDRALEKSTAPSGLAARLGPPRKLDSSKNISGTNAAHGTIDRSTGVPRRFVDGSPTSGTAENFPPDPESAFGSWAIERSSSLPEGVRPPDDPLKPDPLPRDISNEMPRYDEQGRMLPVDAGTDRKREVRRLISRLYRVGAEDVDGNTRLSDGDFEQYLATAREHIKPEHYAVFELTARAVRAGALEWHTAAARLAAYYAPETIGEGVVDILLDLTPIVGQAKAAKDAYEAIEDAADAARFGDARAHREAIAKAAFAMAALLMPGVGSSALRAAQRALGKELHHLIPIYLGGIRNGPLLSLAAHEHRAARDSLHAKMQKYFREHQPKLVHSWRNPGWRIVARSSLQHRHDALAAFYRSLQSSPLKYERDAFEAWQKIFPDALKYFKK